MAYYTTEVRTICESALGLNEHVGYSEIDNMLTNAAPLVFDFDFPMYDEAYRLPLEKKILKHFFTREIGAETVGLWKLWLDEKLNLIMPYYNELYKTTMIEYNPLYDTELKTNQVKSGESGKTNLDNERSDRKANENNDLRHTIERKNTGIENERTKSEINEQTQNDGSANKNNSGIKNDRGETHSVGTDSNVNRFSDTPQGALSDLREDRYLTNATLDNGNNTNDTNNKQSSVTAGNEKQTTHNLENKTGNNENKRSKINNDNENVIELNTGGRLRNELGARSRIGKEEIKNTEAYVNFVVGSNGSTTYPAKIMEFRKSLLNIDAMIIEELNELFLGIWGF